LVLLAAKGQGNKVVLFTLLRGRSLLAKELSVVPSIRNLVKQRKTALAEHSIGEYGKRGLNMQALFQGAYYFTAAAK